MPEKDETLSLRFDRLLETLERKRDLLESAARRIWENPEPPNGEYIASELCAKVLEEAGFTVETGIGGMSTAIRAHFGEGGPTVGLLAEYDALPGLSQKVSTRKEPVAPDEYGQGCGHNLLGVANLGAALALREELAARKLPGTVVFYGCPAEETLTGKGFMARGGAFRELDAALVFHPSRFNRAVTGTLTGLNSLKFHFRGRTAHAAGDPENGRSALDAVELTNVGANYLREHIPQDVRLHYVITEGGVAPNVVPDKASVWYYIRAFTREAVEDVTARLTEIARGAALMTGTQVETEFLGGCYPTAFNSVLATLLDETLREVAPDPWTEDEIAFAAELNRTDPVQWKKACADYQADGNTQLLTGVLPIATRSSHGSTDVGDVSHIVPTGWFYTACYNIGAPGHSWQVASCAGSSIGMKGMMYAARVLSVAGLKLFLDPALSAAARKEFDEKIGDTYVCPIPGDLPVPVRARNAIP